MKQIKILFLTLTTLFLVQTTNAQLSKNFYPQLKTLLEAKFDSLKGEKTAEEQDDYAEWQTWKCKKPLDGFVIELEQLNDFLGAFEMVKITGQVADNSKTRQLFEEIRKQANKLKKDGYAIEDEISKPELKTKEVSKKIEIKKEDIFASIRVPATNDNIFIEIYY